MLSDRGSSLEERMITAGMTTEIQGLSGVTGRAPLVSAVLQAVRVMNNGRAARIHRRKRRSVDQRTPIPGSTRALRRVIGRVLAGKVARRGSCACATSYPKAGQAMSSLASFRM